MQVRPRRARQLLPRARQRPCHTARRSVREAGGRPHALPIGRPGGCRSALRHILELVAVPARSAAAVDTVVDPVDAGQPRGLDVSRDRRQARLLPSVVAVARRLGQLRLPAPRNAREHPASRLPAPPRARGGGRAVEAQDAQVRSKGRQAGDDQADILVESAVQVYCSFRVRAEQG